MEPKYYLNLKFKEKNIQLRKLEKKYELRKGRRRKNKLFLKFTLILIPKTNKKENKFRS